MKLWALILAASAIFAFAAPVAAVAAASPAGNGGSARSVNTVTRSGPQTTVAFRNLLPGKQPSLRQLHGPDSAADAALAGSEQLDAVLAPPPSAWQLWLTSRWAWAWLL